MIFSLCAINQSSITMSRQKEQATMEKGKTASVIEELQNDPNKMAFAVGIFVGILTLFLIFIWSRKGGLRSLSKRGILILGPLMPERHSYSISWYKANLSKLLHQ